jgi:hypothetical protein
MSAYEHEDAYRIVAADGGVRVVTPGGFATTALAECYADAAAAREAIERAIRDGLPAVAIIDETAGSSGAPSKEQ